MKKIIKLIVSSIIFIGSLILPIPTNQKYINTIIKKPKEKRLY